MSEQSSQIPDGPHVCLVTGASQGIGRAIAVALARQKVTCILAARNLERLREVAEECEAAGAPAHVCRTDLLNATSCRDLVAFAMQRCGRIDILVNNAGVYMNGDFGDAEVERCIGLLDTNVKSAVYMCRFAMRALQKSKHATIINIASVAGVQGVANEAMYAASKHALVGLSDSLFAEFREQRIKVCTLCPGLVATPMAENRGVDFRKALQPEDVAQAALYIVNTSAVACPTRIVLQPLQEPLC